MMTKDVIIVAKTHMSNAVCVGGVLEDSSLVRLLDQNGQNQPSNSTLDVGDVYTINFTLRTHLTPPHVEDILVHSWTHKSTCAISDIENVLKNDLSVNIWQGNINTLFDGKLQWTLATGGSGYISQSGGIPNSSVGFWMPDEDLIKRIGYENKIRYLYPSNQRKITFKGFQAPLDIIPANTLLRVSLARWWSPNPDEEEKCFLQLSGWYN